MRDSSPVLLACQMGSPYNGFATSVLPAPRSLNVEFEFRIFLALSQKKKDIRVMPDKKNSNWLEGVIEKLGYTILDWETTSPIIRKRWKWNVIEYPWNSGKTKRPSMEHQSLWVGTKTEPRKEFEGHALRFIQECGSSRVIEYISVRILDETEEPPPYIGWRMRCYVFYAQ